GCQRASAPVPAFAPPTGADARWQPLGPAATLRGLVDSGVRVAGRVNDLAVSADGARVYAASALGGLWYSPDAGGHWQQVGRFGTVDASTVRASSHALACGAVHVRFGATAADDEVWLGTGDAVTGPSDSGYVGRYGGVGILHAVGPVQLVLDHPDADPWDPPQAPTLAGQGMLRVVADPAAPRSLLAATTAGAWSHDPAAAAGTDPWSLVVVPDWEIPGLITSSQVRVTDAAWTPATTTGTTHGSRRWLVAVDGAAPGYGLWCSEAGAAFTRVPLPGAAPSTGVSRLSLAADPAHPDVLYVLGSGPRLWRVDGAAAAPTAMAVRGLPNRLFGVTGDQSDYDCAIAVDPRDPLVVVVAGAAVASSRAVHGGGWPAAMYRLRVRLPGPGHPTARTSYVGGESDDASWIGSEVHADVHRVHWSTPTGATVPHVLVGCDGGLFRSTRDGDLGTFRTRSGGMAVTEPGFLGTHPLSPGVLLAGMQDNGGQLRVGESLWVQAAQVGDGGGVAFDPGAPGRFVVQATDSAWYDDTNLNVSPTWRSPSTQAASDAESGRSAFYSAPAVVRTAPAAPAAPVTRLAVGTDRVWLSERWAASTWTGSSWRRAWVTLPTGTDPRRQDATGGTALTQDRLDPGPPRWGSTIPRTGVRALRWRDPTHLLVLMQGRLYQLEDTGATRWTPTTVVDRTPPPAPLPATTPPAVAGPGLPGLGICNDLAVQDPATGALYVATSDRREPLWFWDGAGTCHPTGLGAVPPGTRSPAYAVVVDPADPTSVFVGTTTGVWQGRLTPGAAGPPATPPTWVWRQYANGLPHAAAQDLAIGVWPRPGPQQPLRLLRVALQARGVFEVDLDQPLTATTYLRAVPTDTRQVLPTPTADPLFTPGLPRRSWQSDWAAERDRDHRTPSGLPGPHPDGTPPGSHLWHAGPDVVPRPARVGPTGTPWPSSSVPGLPWTSQPTDRFWLWTLQTALRALPATVPDAAQVVADGRWTPWFGRRLVGIRRSLGLRATARVDAVLWDRPEVAQAMWTPPWDGVATEADLAELVVGAATPRVGGAGAAAQLAAASGALLRPHQVDVL
ncbi:hypothetical protein, partial [Angustibacter aerolatus]